MRKLTFLVIILAGIYASYWFVGARAIESNAVKALADLRQAGWDVAYRDLETVGFPSRFDTTVTDLEVVSGDGQIAWRGPFLQVFALSYQPNMFIAAFPQTFEMDLQGQRFGVENDRLRLSGAVTASTDLALSDITVEAAQVAITSPVAGVIRFDRALTALRQSQEGADIYDIYLEVNQLTLADIAGQLPDTITRLAIDGAVSFDRPLDRHAFSGSGAEPALRAVDLRNLTMDVPDMSLTATGQIDIDALGVPDGRITFRTAQWRRLIDYLVVADVIDPDMRRTVTNVAQAMAAGGDVLTLPVTFQNGFMSVGPIPVGPAPRLR
ncbi:DUF2125 domain-containing protein [Yoonia sp.]|uniref:DUF2125 domain-containing protein n=1 Tax=Yoonia sp. TaxID=2212373 RepID=UPI003F6C1B79